MPYLVKDAGLSASGKTTSITLDAPHPDPDKGYPTWKVSFDHRKGQPAPTTGMTIQCTPVANDQGYYWIKTWHPVEANAGPQQAGALVQHHVNGAAMGSNFDDQYRPKPPSASNKLNIVLAPDKISMAVMGIIGRHVANMKDFPPEEELTGMVKNAASSYINGVTQAMNPDVAPPPANNEEPDWLNQ